MTTAARAAIVARTWSFWAGLIAQIVGAVQIGLVAFEANIPAIAYGITSLLLGTALQVAKYLTITPPPIDTVARDHEGADDGHE